MKFFFNIGHSYVTDANLLKREEKPKRFGQDCVKKKEEKKRMEKSEEFYLANKLKTGTCR